MITGISNEVRTTNRIMNTNDKTIDRCPICGKPIVHYKNSSVSMCHKCDNMLHSLAYLKYKKLYNMGGEVKNILSVERNKKILYLYDTTELSMEELANKLGEEVTEVAILLDTFKSRQNRLSTRLKSIYTKRNIDNEKEECKLSDTNKQNAMVYRDVILGGFSEADVYNKYSDEYGHKLIFLIDKIKNSYDMMYSIAINYLCTDYNYKDIATLLNIKPSTVEWRLKMLGLTEKLRNYIRYKNTIIHEIVISGKSIKQVSDEYVTSIEAINNIMKKYKEENEIILLYTLGNPKSMLLQKLGQGNYSFINNELSKLNIAKNVRIENQIINDLKMGMNKTDVVLKYRTTLMNVDSLLRAS